MHEQSGIIDSKSGKLVCPLKSVEVKAVLNSTLAEVTVVQHYRNDSTGNIEALYTFPLPHQAQVTGFLVMVEEQELFGEFRGKEEAFQAYDRALKKGDSAFLLESHRPDIFQLSLGNIAAGENITVSISYLEDLKSVDNEVRWVLPTVVAPRYIPGKAAGRKTGMGTVGPTDRVPDADFITPPVGDAPYTLKVVATFIGIPGLNKVASPSHSIEVMMRDGSFVVTLAKETELLDSDFVLTAVIKKEQESSLSVVQVDEQKAFGQARIVVVLDDVTVGQNNYDYTFLIDVSGSMAGEKLEQAKRALGISLRNLVEGDMFNIVAFESNFCSFSGGSVSYSQENLSKADNWIAALRDIGGTEILEPLRYVLEHKQSELERVVLLFTDGHVGNEEEIISYVRQHNKGLNLFAFGIDTAVNKYFIDSLSAAGNGMPEYVYPGERIEDKVIRQFSRIHQPYLGLPKVIGSDGTEVETVPALPARLYNEDEYIFSMCSDLSEKIISLEIHGEFKGEKVVFPIRLSSVGDARLLSLKWAKDKIRRLEESIGGGNLRREEISKKEIIELSKTYGLMSTLTSLVAVYQRENKEKGVMETVVVPVAEPRGWGVQDFGFSAFGIFRDNLDSNFIAMPSYSAEASRKKSRRIEDAKWMVEGFSSPKAKRSSQNDLSDVIRMTAGKQNADGSFGSGNERNLKTACFVIGMLLTKDEWKPYRIQVMKAGKVLRAFGDEELLLKAIAISMLVDHKVLGSEASTEVVVKLDDKQRIQFEAFKVRDLTFLNNIVRKVKGKSEKDIILSLLQISIRGSN